jgi:type IV pilus assembly protein PilP
MKLNNANANIIILLSALLLGGCVSNDISDLQAWVAQVLARPGGQIPRLPEITPYQAYTYQSGKDGARDPFQSFYQQVASSQDVKQDSGLTAEMEKEIKNRNREELEAFELDSLKMVGVMKDENNHWGIIRDPTGTVHRVKVGNYMGRNIGKITNIFEDHIDLREIVQNSQGRWEERQASIALDEVE